MKIEKEKNVIFTLTMEEDEVNWLNAIMQNPLYDTSLQDEDPTDRDMRAKFWEATKS